MHPVSGSLTAPVSGDLIFKPCVLRKFPLTPSSMKLPYLNHPGDYISV